jgi:hypothetical protein
MNREFLYSFSPSDVKFTKKEEGKEGAMEKEYLRRLEQSVVMYSFAALYAAPMKEEAKQYLSRHDVSCEKKMALVADILFLDPKLNPHMTTSTQNFIQEMIYDLYLFLFYHGLVISKESKTITINYRLQCASYLITSFDPLMVHPEEIQQVGDELVSMLKSYEKECDEGVKVGAPVTLPKEAWELYDLLHRLSNVDGVFRDNFPHVRQQADAFAH